MTRRSRQKELLLQLMCSGDLNHPTAIEVYICARKKMPNISLGTVYRNLNSMCENGDIIKIESPDGSGLRFDQTVEDHAHAICCECGNIFDLCGKEISNIRSRAQASGFFVKAVNISLSGLCKKCHAKNG